VNIKPIATNKNAHPFRFIFSLLSFVHMVKVGLPAYEAG
jgi:hypothetical protein